MMGWNGLGFCLHCSGMDFLKFGFGIFAAFSFRMVCFLPHFWFFLRIGEVCRGVCGGLYRPFGVSGCEVARCGLWTTVIAVWSATLRSP